MRRALFATGLTASVVIAAAAAACNPLFGIVSRDYGPTWCEEDAQATTNGYCVDFDRDASLVLPGAINATVNGTTEVTDATASSLPNSLAVVSKPLTSAEAGTSVGVLQSFGSMTASGLGPFTCQVDVPSSDLGFIVDAGVSTGVIGLGAQSTATSGAPEVVVLAFVPGGSLDFALVDLRSPTQDVSPVDRCPKPQTLPPGNLLIGSGAPEWVTLELDFELVPLILGDKPCVLAVDAGAPHGRRDGGVPKLPQAYSVTLKIASFVVSTIYVVDQGFFGQPYFLYGLFVQGPAPPVALHFDNVRCTTLPTGAR